MQVRYGRSATQRCTLPRSLRELGRYDPQCICSVGSILGKPRSFIVVALPRTAGLGARNSEAIDRVESE